MPLEHEKSHLTNILYWIDFVKRNRYWPHYLGNSEHYGSTPLIIPILSLLDEETIIAATNRNKQHFLDHPTPLTKELKKRGYLK